MTSFTLSEKGELWTYETLLCLDKSNFTYTKCYCEENVFLFVQELIEKTRESDLDIDIYGVFISNHDKTCPIWFQRASPLPSQQPVVWDYHVICLVKVSHSKDRLEMDNHNKNKSQLQHSRKSSKEIFTASKENVTTTPTNTEWLVYDFDTILPFPVNAHEYFHKCFRPSLYYNFELNNETGNLSMNRRHLDTAKCEEEGTSTKRNDDDDDDCNQRLKSILSMEPLLRVVDGAILLSNFASDRSHMIKKLKQHGNIQEKTVPIEYMSPPPNYPCIQPRNQTNQNLKTSSSSCTIDSIEEVEMKMNLEEWLEMSIEVIPEENEKGTACERGKVMQLNDYLDFISQ